MNSIRSDVAPADFRSPGPIRDRARIPRVAGFAVLLVAALLVAVLLVALSPVAVLRADDKPAENDRFFENQIRPLLVERCTECHGADKQEAGLRLDSRQALLDGGDRGPAIVPGKPKRSLLVAAVRRQGELEMPPKQALSKRHVAAVERWIELGAPWPRGSGPLSPGRRRAGAKDHWAFQPLSDPTIPVVPGDVQPENPIDAFVAAGLLNAGLAAAPTADRRTLLRRLSYSLTGLPPTPAEMQQWLADEKPDAYARQVERLLDSPHYGEHWGRHWLDVARYSDTKGYVYAREERFWVHAWTYRDWVVEALNRDLPYDRFLLLQLAADQVDNRRAGDLAAMGFLTIGRRFLGVKHDIIDDRIDVVCRGTMGLTVGCARCHDHKYDPIPTADYYSLYGIFDSSAEKLVRLDSAKSSGAAAKDGAAEFEKQLAERQAKLREKMAAHRATSAARVRKRVADYLGAQTELEKFPAQGFDQIFQKDDLLPAFVRRWEDYLFDARRRGDRVFRAWRVYFDARGADFASRAEQLTSELQALKADEFHPTVAKAFATAPQSFDEVIARYAAVFAAVQNRWEAAGKAADAKRSARPARMADPADEELRQVLYGGQSPCEVPPLPIVHSERFFDTASCTELWKLQGEVDRLIIRSANVTRHALTLVDQASPVTARVRRRGKSTDKGRAVPRWFPGVVAGADRKPFRRGSGRLELAQAIVDPANPLTARVIVNRVWARHFGSGLVTTPSDFGTRAQRPSHPELLDWLSRRFVTEGWRLKKLHRWIVTSRTFQQATTGPVAEAARVRAVQVDPANRLLWRANARRLTFEEFRDSLLVATGELDRRLGGRPVELFKAELPRRRTLYGLVDRQFLPGTLRTFDFANPDLHIPRRSETTVPQQALFLMNHRLVLERARRLAKAVAVHEQPAARIKALFERTLQRPPTPLELKEAEQLISTADREATAPPRATAADWRYGFGELDEAAGRVKNFQPLPHFSGTAWQGGPNFPDAKLGWVQLTATGGHPGNTRGHACVRRWIAPKDMTIAIESLLKHEAPPGDGIRAFIVSSRMGVVQSVKLHNQQQAVNVATLDVAAGETIDFVVDIDKVLNNDQYLWRAKIAGRDASAKRTWDSEADFPPNTSGRLSPWAQLAHVLLCTNEFLFVD